MVRLGASYNRILGDYTYDLLDVSLEFASWNVTVVLKQLYHGGSKLVFVERGNEVMWPLDRVVSAGCLILAAKLLR